MQILRCVECKEYTLEEIHCSAKAVPPAPPKFSVEDKYADLKRKVKEPERIEKGWL